SFQGTLEQSAEQLYDLFQFQDKISERLGKLYTYAHMRYDQDTTNSAYQAMNQKAESVLTTASSNMSFIVLEILQIDEETINGVLNEHKELQLYKKTLHEISRQRAHILNEKVEVLLSEASAALQTPYQILCMLNNADLILPKIKDEHGNEVDLTHGRYIHFLESQDRSVREAAFKAMHQTFGNFKNTFAATLTGNVKKDNFNAKVRHYHSASQEIGRASCKEKDQ